MSNTIKARKTEMAQLVARHPEMQSELELIREAGKQLAELMLEYPADQSNRERDERGEEQIIRYKCIGCKNV